MKEIMNFEKRNNLLEKDEIYIIKIKMKYI